MMRLFHVSGVAVVAVGISAFLVASASADVALTTSSNAAWNTAIGTPVYTSTADPGTSGGANQNNNGVTSVGASAYALSETFTPSSSFTLGAVGLSTGGQGVAATLSLRLFDVTGAPTTGSLNGSFTQGSGAFYAPITDTLADLFGNGAGLSFTQNPNGGTQDTFVLSNGTTNDLVALTAGHTYALEVWVPYAAGVAWTWSRHGAVAADGQMMFSPDAAGNGTGPQSQNPGNYPTEDGRITITSAGFAGGAPRTADLALYGPVVAVPEPGTLILFSLAVPALAWAARRRSKVA